MNDTCTNGECGCLKISKKTATRIVVSGFIISIIAAFLFGRPEILFAGSLATAAIVVTKS